MTRALLMLIFLFAFPVMAMSPCDELLSARVQLQQKWVGGQISEAVYRLENKILDEKEKSIDVTQTTARKEKAGVAAKPTSDSEKIMVPSELKPHLSYKLPAKSKDPYRLRSAQVMPDGSGLVFSALYQQGEKHGGAVYALEKGARKKPQLLLDGGGFASLSADGKKLLGQTHDGPQVLTTPSSGPRFSVQRDLVDTNSKGHFMSFHPTGLDYLLRGSRTLGADIKLWSGQKKAPKAVWGFTEDGKDFDFANFTPDGQHLLVVTEEDHNGAGFQVLLVNLKSLDTQELEGFYSANNDVNIQAIARPVREARVSIILDPRNTNDLWFFAEMESGLSLIRWEIDSRGLETMLELKGVFKGDSHNNLLDAGFDPSGRVAFAHFEKEGRNVFKMWNLENLKEIKMSQSAHDFIAGNPNFMDSQQRNFSADGQFFIATDEKEIRTYRIQESQLIDDEAVE